MKKSFDTANRTTRSKAAGEPGKVIIRNMSGRHTHPGADEQQPEAAPEPEARTNVNL